MLDSFTKQQKLEILQLLDNLCMGAEHSHTDPDDWSGLSTQYTLDSEAFRKNIQEKIKEVELEE